MSEEWGPWIEHDGKGCPVVGYFVRIEEAGGIQQSCIAEDGPSWAWHPDYYRVIRYRVRKPRALQQLRDMIADLPAKEDA